MRILVIGGGGREHALCWKLKQSPLLSELHCTPGNAGIAQIAQIHSGDPLAVAQQIGAEFVVVGPDAYLAEGLVDRLNAAGIPAFGPTQRGAQLEASKIFCKELLKNYGIPTGDFEPFETPEEAKAYLNDYDVTGPIVVKADGLAVGKGVVIAPDRDAAIDAVDEVLGIAQATMPDASTRILIEEFMQGEEVSLLALTDGENLLPLVPAQDHKRVGEGDSGPNTGGMGCYSPVPSFTAEMYEAAVETILKPTVQALKSEGIEYRGVLYAGLMLTENGIKVLEYNCRFGDPETQVVLPRLQSDLLPLLLACAGVSEYSLPDVPCEWTDDAGVCVVLASEGYPGNYRKGDVISGLDEAQTEGALVFHAGTAQREGAIVTSGGRVLAVTALGSDFQAARKNCYGAVEQIHFEGAHFRRDIGWRCLQAQDAQP
ncbi:MAG TPA: phosphoribosylamine--glycine ligase [Abditibacteriaceae bacterium]|jgi:phosphoribosylamine--glycine ligase